MNKQEVLNKINNSLYELKKAIDNSYRGKVFVVSNYRIQNYSKTKRGAEGFIKRNSGFAYYDEYFMDMNRPYDGLEISEIKLSELTNFNDAELWEKTLKNFLGCDYSNCEWFVNGYIDLVTNEEFKKCILDNAQFITCNCTMRCEFKDKF